MDSAPAVGTFVVFRGLQKAASLNDHVGVVLDKPRDGRVGVHALEESKDVRVRLENLVISTDFCENSSALFAALALRERVGSIVTPHPFDAPWASLMGEPGPLPPLERFISREQYTVNRHHEGAIAACNGD